VRDDDPLPALPRSRRARDVAAQPALREHRPHAPGGDRVDRHAGELVRPSGDRVGHRRPRHERGGGPLPGARGPPPRAGLAAHLRAGGHRPEGQDAPVGAVLRPGGAHAGVPRRRAGGGRAQPVPDGGLHPAAARPRRARGRAGAGGEARRVLLLARPGDLRAAGERGGVRPAVPGLRRGAAPARARVGRAVGRLGRPGPGRGARAAPAAPAHRPRPAGLLAPHGRPRRRSHAARRCAPASGSPTRRSRPGRG
jgi:translation initiation factor IF-2